MRGCLPAIVLTVILAEIGTAGDRVSVPDLARDALPILKARCVKCHGPAKHEGKLSLATPNGIARGGKAGAPVVAGRPESSLLWKRVDADEMPPDEPLEDQEKQVLRAWIESGARGLPAAAPSDSENADHWAFSHLVRPEPPAPRRAERARTPIDRFLLANLERHDLTFQPEADRATLIRRVAFDLTGLPPTIEETARFESDPAIDAYERMVDRYLDSPRHGERWGKFWLDTAGYADSNGYFAADTDRPLAYRYRDYVVRSLNADKPFDRFIREQLAGDEIAGYKPGDPVTSEIVDLLVATHLLRNAPDGTGESDGNPDELRADRYAVLEGTSQILGTALFGLTFQCARCHDHKFEPFSQKDYYALYAILQPVYDLDHWVKPQERIGTVPLPEEAASWKADIEGLDAQIAAGNADLAAWVKQNRPRGRALFADDFNTDEPLAKRWSATAPGDDAAGGATPVRVDSQDRPGAQVVEGALHILEAGDGGERWLSTKEAFDWTPEAAGDWIQATFDLIDVRIPRMGKPAARIGYFIALQDYQDNGLMAGGNILLDGNPDGGAAVHLDYPGTDSKGGDAIGSIGYRPGGNFGVRVTNLGEGKYRLEQVVDGMPEPKSITLTSRDLPDGGFGFEYCCGRSFIVDHVLIETGHDTPGAADPLRATLAEKRKAIDAAVKHRKAIQDRPPGRIAWVTDQHPEVQTHVLNRGVYNAPGDLIVPAPPGVLSDPEENPFVVRSLGNGSKSSGRRLALADWLTRPGSRPAALLARVTVNRLWQDHFGTALAATPENLGYSGTPPRHPELLEFLASELIANGWRLKPIHRLIVSSSVYRQSSAPRPELAQSDPDNLDLARFPLRRLDAEAIRDAMLAVTGELDARQGGPYTSTQRNGDGEIVIGEKAEGGKRRSIYLQQRRTQIVSLLDVFDAPSLVASCPKRTPTTVPTQALGLLNSDFAARRSRAFAERIQREAGPDPAARIEMLFRLALGRAPEVAEREAVVSFLSAQPARYADSDEAAGRAWVDLCQMVLASNAFLYVE